MQVNFAHGGYRSRPVFFGDLSALDAELYASMQASLDAFSNSLRQASAGQREAMVASALASLRASAGHAAEGAYNQAKAAGASEADAKAAAANVAAAYHAQEAAYMKAAADAALTQDAQNVAMISARASKARSILNESFGLTEVAPVASHTMLLTVLAAGAAAYFALKG